MNLLNERLAVVRRQKQLYESEIERIIRTTNDKDKINKLNAKITICNSEIEEILKDIL